MQPPASEMPLPVYTACSKPCVHSAEAAAIRGDIANMSMGLIEMKHDLQRLGAGLGDLYNGIYEMAYYSYSHGPSSSSDSNYSDSGSDSADDGDVSSFSEPGCKRDKSDHARHLDQRVLRHDLRSGFRHLAGNTSGVFLELANVYKAAQKVGHHEVQAQLLQALNILHFKLCTVRLGIADIHQDLADADLGPRGSFEEKANDHAEEIESVKTQVAPDSAPSVEEDAATATQDA